METVVTEEGALPARTVFEMIVPARDAGSSFNVLSKTSARGQLKIFLRILAGVVARGD